MIRFHCPSCQKMLSAPEEKAGLRLPCPGCKNPVEIPAPARGASASSSRIAAAPTASVSLSSTRITAAPSISHGDGRGVSSPKGSLAWRMLRELIAIIYATFRQTLKPFTLVFEIQRRNRLRRKAADAKFALGQRLNETQQGDPKTRARIKALGERIQSIQDVRGDCRQQVSERKALIAQLAEPLLARATAPESVEGEHERARDTMAKYQARQKALSGAFGGFLPPNGQAWRRIVMGYALTLLAAFGGWHFYMFATAGARHTREMEEQLLADKKAADQKRQDDEAKWGKERNTEDIVEICGPSVALIRFQIGKKGGGGGTGFVIRPGMVVTNAHVVESAMPEDLKVYFPSNKELAKKPFSCKILFFDRKRDLAFLAVDPKVPPLRLAANFEFKGGRTITIIGCPGVGPTQLENAVTTGVLSIKYEVEKMPFYQLGASVNPGNSGGPVFDNHGQVIGVVTLKANQEGIAFCVPWQDLKDRVEAMEKDDPHRIAAGAESMQRLHVVIEKVFLSAQVYSKIMQIYSGLMREATSRGRPASEGAAKARAISDAILRKVAPFLVDDKIKTIGSKLKDDANLPDDVRRKFGDLWKTYEELKQNVESPTESGAAYMNKSRTLETRLENNFNALRESLGFEAPKLDEGEDFGP
jgi:S1-C subfamily serine protease